MSRKPRILFYDIETSPNLGYTWGKWEQNVIQFKDQWQLLSFAYKWQGEKEVFCIGRDDFTDKSDGALVRALWKVLNEADVVISHNGDEFDNKKARAKFVEFGLKPPRPSKSIDTKKMAKNNFSFNSNSLNDLGETLGLGKKAETGGFETWLKCMAGDEKAWRKMKRYNKQDVRLLEKVYNRMKIWDQRHPHLGAMGEMTGKCPVCQSTKVQSRGWYYTRCTRRPRRRCMKCGHWSLGPIKLIK